MSTLLLLLLHIAAASAASINIKEGIAGQVCFVQPLPFASKSYTYTVTVDPASIQLAPGCDASQILLSPLYTSGSCLEPNDNNKAGCSSSDGTVITGTVSSAGSRVPLNETTPFCNQVFSTQNSSTAIVPLDGATTYARGTVTCGPSSTAYLFFQNNCPAVTSNPASQTNFTIRVDYTINYPSCSGSGSYYYDDYYGNSWSSWPIVLGIGVAVFILVFVLLTICGKRRRAQQMQQQQMMMGGPHVQMMPPPPPPPGMGIATGMPYNGPTGYPIPPPQPPSTANYVPPPSGTSSAYPSQPMNVQPSGGVSTYPQPEGVAQPAIWYAGGKPPS